MRLPFLLSLSSLHFVVFHLLSFSVFFLLQLTVLFMSSSILLNQTLAMLSNANARLSLDGYPRSDCWKMKHRSFCHLPHFQAKKVSSVVNMFLYDLVSAELLVRKQERELKMTPSSSIWEDISKHHVEHWILSSGQSGVDLHDKFT